MKKERLSNIELLRILSMMMIIIYHFSVHSELNYNEGMLVNNYFAKCLTIFGKLGVNIFIAISGYFLIDSKFKLTKAMYLVEKVLFYSISLSIIGLILGIESSISVTTFFPLVNKEWWFMTCYVLLYILSPFINTLLQNLNKKQYKTLLIIGALILCVIPFILSDDFYYNDFIWFVFIYAVAGYIRLHRKPTKTAFFYFFVSILCLFAQCTLIIVFSNRGIIQSRTNLIVFSNPNNPFIFVAAISLFMGFLKIKVQSNKLINTLSAGTFSIYLIHDHSISQELIWKTIVKANEYVNSALFIPLAIISVVLVFIITYIIGYSISFALSKPTRKINNIIEEKLISMQKK